MASPRSYSDTTKKALYAWSGNQCAYPQCTKTVVEPATEYSDVVVTSDICHIHAPNPGGPRWQSELSPKYLKSPDNLIVLCPYHHRIVDRQPEKYPADILKKWKKMQETKMQKQISQNQKNNSLGLSSSLHLLTDLVDQKIKHDINILRKSQFFAEFDTIRFAMALAHKTIEGEFSLGTDPVKSLSLSWCARFLSRTEPLDGVQGYLKLAKTLDNSSETEIAKSFVDLRKGNKKAALSTLANIASPPSRSAALMIVAYHEGRESTIKWMQTAEITAADLDSDGKGFLLGLQLDMACWEAAFKVLEVITNHDLNETPYLHFLIAITRLISAVPAELRDNVRYRTPLFAAVTFPLDSQATAMTARREAYRHFIIAANEAKRLDCSEAAKTYDEYALWLELRDPETFNRGKQRLQDSLRGPESSLHFVFLGYQFGIRLDPLAIEKEINRQIALYGGLTQITAAACLALAFMQESPEAGANYIDYHFDNLVEFLDKKAMWLIQFEMLARAGRLEKANEYHKRLLEEGLVEFEKDRIETTLAEAKGADPVETREAQFKRSNRLGDLKVLVTTLETKQVWDDLCQYGEILYQRTQDLADAERWANALFNARRMEALYNFLEKNSALVESSTNLRLLYCWTLYYGGALLEARCELEKIGYDQKNAHYRALQIKVGLTLGDWQSLSVFIAKEYRERDERSAQDLITAAQLALHLGLPNAKELLFAAANKGKNNASILISAYLGATNAGWEEDPKAAQWLRRSIALSGNEGPIQQMTLQAALEQNKVRERYGIETRKNLQRGDTPILLAARSLGRSLIDLTLFQAWSNLSQSDPRRRSIIPAYSGQRQMFPCNTKGQVGIEPTTLLTLYFLNLLDNALDAFETVHIPHSTLIWLFEEKQRAAFHQPSRIRDAHQIRHLLHTGYLESLIPSTATDSTLSSQIGYELATLITEAEKADNKEGIKSFVVRSSPVHRLSSLLDEKEADLTEHFAVMSSCVSVVDKLQEKGQITAQEAQRAREYMQLHEKPWPHQPKITDGAILYLDDLTMTYFLHLGILEKLYTAGFRPVVSSEKISEVNELLAYESISDKISTAIEDIRSAINTRIESGKIKLTKQFNVDKPIGDTLLSELLSQDAVYDLIISDDRFLNQHKGFNTDNASTPICSTLDLLDILNSDGIITRDALFEHRTRLRRAGYAFIPVKEDELVHHLAASMPKEDAISETAELKAIRENILCVQMSDWLQIPKESPWLDTLFEVFDRVLKTLWQSDADLSGAPARSKWLLNLIDIRGWVHRFDAEYGHHIDPMRGSQILHILTPSFDAPQDVKEAYWHWVENTLLRLIKETNPDLYAWIVTAQKKRIAYVIETELSKRGPI